MISNQVSKNPCPKIRTFPNTERSLDARFKTAHGEDYSVKGRDVAEMSDKTVEATGFPADKGDAEVTTAMEMAEVKA